MKPEAKTPILDKIFILIDCIGRGGAEKVAVTLANSFAEQGREVHLLILRHNIEYKLSSRVSLHVMSDLRFAKGYAYSVLEVWRGIFWARRVLNHEASGARLVLSHLTRSNLINITLGILMSCHKAICVSHNSLGFYKNSNFVKRFMFTVMGVIFPLARRTVCVSKRMAADYRRLYIFRKCSVTTVYNPVMLPIDVALSNECKEGIDELVHVAMIGRIHAVKRHDLAIMAMSLLKNKGRHKYILHIVGDGPEENRVREAVRSAKIDDCVIMYGWMDDPTAILQKCSLSLLCSDTEGFPNSIVESLAMGVPVVATDCVSGPRELLAPECGPEVEIFFDRKLYPARHGVLVKLDDVGALAAAIEYQVERSNQFQQRAACIEFAQQFEATRVAIKYLQLFDNALS